MAFQLPKSDFIPHPEGTFTGCIIEVVDRGMVDTQYGPKHRISIHIESEEAQMEDGQPFVHFHFTNLASGKNANLTRWREKLLERPLSDEETKVFDADREMVGKRIKYMIEHNSGNDGRTFANLLTWKALEGQAPPIDQFDAQDALQATEAPVKTPPDDDDSDLPF